MGADDITKSQANIELKPSTSQSKSSPVNSFSTSYQHASYSDAAPEERRRKRSRVNPSNQSFKHCRLSEDQVSTESGQSSSRENSSNSLLRSQSHSPQTT